MEAEPKEDRELLNGPALTGQAITQDQIDALLAG